MKQKYSIFIILSCVFILFSFTTKLYPNADSLTAKLEKIKQKYSVVGMSIAVSKNGTIVYNHGFGSRDLSRSLQVNDSTIYRIASISKMIAATALMQLWEQKKFNLDDYIGRYLGFQIKNQYFPNDSITFRKLLSHTSSIRDGSGYDGFLSATYSQNPPPNLSTLLMTGGLYYTTDMFSSSKSPSSNYFTYSNVNFGVVGSLVEKISGERFDIYCKKYIFDSLNIAGSFNIQDIININNVAVLYRKSGSSWVPQTDNYQGVKPAPRNLSGYVIGNNGVIFGPQGGLRISSYDLAKFMIAHQNGGLYQNSRILKAETMDTMHKSIWIYNGSNGDNYYGIFNAYGFGNHRTTNLLPGSTLIGHPGEAYGLISDLYYSSDGTYGIVFITNGGTWGYGTYSGWYNIEEEVFQACKSELNNLTIMDDKNDMINNFNLFQNYPNPFNPSTIIQFTLPTSSKVTLSLFNTLGQKVQNIRDENYSAGAHNVNFESNHLPSGNYFCKLDVYNKNNLIYSKSIKMVVIK